jgi:hypothetical protein
MRGDAWLEQMVWGHTKKLTNKMGVVEKWQLLEVQKTVKMQFLTI